MKKTTILTMLLALVLAISPLGAFAADEGSDAEGAAAAAEAALEAEETPADEILSDDPAPADELEAFEAEELDADAADEEGLTADAVTPGEWNAGRTQYISNGQPVKGLFVASKDQSLGGYGLYYADSSGYVVGSTSTVKGRIDPVSDRFYVLKNGTWTETSSVKAYYINSGSDPYMVEKCGAYGGSTKYFVKEDGTIKTSKGIATDDNDNRYYVQSGGKIKTDEGFIKYKASNGETYTYYVKDGGKIRTTEGTFRANDAKLHLIKGESGHVVTDKGFVKYDGDIYYVSGKYGALAENKTLTVKNAKYHVDSKGRVKTGLHSWEGNKYLANGSGKLYTQGIHKYNNKKYYCTNKYGKVAVKKKFSYKGSTYFASKDAHLLSGIILWYDNKYYYCYDSCKLMTKSALFKTNGKWYANKSGGGLRQDAMVTYNYKHYYAGSKAAILTSSFKYNGHKVNPNSSTGEISFKDWNAIHGNKWKYYEYVQVKISKQNLIYYLNGEKVVNCSIISGDPSSTPTVKGTYKIRSMKKNQSATYEGKKFNVVCWMNYSGSSPADTHMTIGDAPYWVNSFGGSIYKTNGSDGEIWIPYSAALTLWNNLDINSIIVIS